MAVRVRVWVGAVVMVVALVGLGVHLAVVGLDKADKWASVIGVFVALAGLAAAVYGLVTGRHDNSGGDGGDGETPSGGAVASGERSIAIGGDNSGIVSTGDDSTNTPLR
ncbi:hypothetical protein [Actinomadura sp. 21ATH]|uniref:hypothetical protein n=1 Tax=Actinomadura sp. 21ATH TaxID=1735444 RepID=UPI0035C03E26